MKLKLTMPKHIAVAIAGGVLAVALGAGVIFLGRGPDNDPADILPSAQTVALVRHADRQGLLVLQTYVTGFDSVALPDHPVDVALLTLPNGSPAWAVFDEHTAPVGMRFSISASDASVQAMIGKGEDRLSQDDSYRRLKGFLSDGPSAYLRFPGLTLKPSTAIASAFAPSRPVAVRFGADATDIVLPQGGVIESISSVLSPSARTLVQSRIRTVSAALFGSALSPAYDIFPLFERNTAAILKGDSFAIAGKASPVVSARDGVDALHDAFGTAKAGYEVVNLPLDDQFSYTGIRQAEGAAERTTMSENGFAVETSTRGSDGSLLTALQGSSVVLSNGKQMLEEGEKALTGSGAGAVFSFSADQAALRKLFPAATAGMQWNVTRESGRLILEIPR